MWERFSYYGMRALLILFMTAAITEGGLGFDDKTSGAIYGLYTMGVYLLALPGGWLADRLFGLKKISLVRWYHHRNGALYDGSTRHLFIG